MEQKAKVISNLIWRFFERCGAQLVSFAVSVVLARILDPDLYGPITKAAVFTAILLVFVIAFLVLARLVLSTLGKEKG